MCPSIIALCVTKISSNNLILKMFFRRFNVITRQTKGGQSGLMTAVRKEMFASMVDITSTINKNILVARLNSGKYNRVILAYAAQESEKMEAREDFFTELEIELAKCMVAGDKPLIVGDFIARLVYSNNELVSKSGNGSLLLNLIEENELSVVDFNEKCIGKWKHVVRTKENKSVLDYIIVDDLLKLQVQSLLIDESTIWCPYRVDRRCITPTCFADHNATILKIQISSKKKVKNKDDFSGRKLTPERLENYKEIINVRLSKYNGKATYNSFEKDIKQVMGKCFLKTNQITEESGNEIKHNNIYFKFVQKINSFAKGGKTQRRVAKTYRDMVLKIQAKKVAIGKSEMIKKTVIMMTVNEKFTSEKFWKIRKALNKKSQVCTSIITANGNEVFGDDCIRNAYRDEFRQRLEMEEVSEDMKASEKN